MHRLGWLTAKKAVSLISLVVEALAEPEGLDEPDGLDEPEVLGESDGVGSGVGDGVGDEVAGGDDGVSVWVGDGAWVVGGGVVGGVVVGGGDVDLVRVGVGLGLGECVTTRIGSHARCTGSAVPVPACVVSVDARAAVELPAVTRRPPVIRPIATGRTCRTCTKHMRTP